MVDWDLAVTTAKRLMRPSPEISRDEARAGRRGPARGRGRLRGPCPRVHRAARRGRDRAGPGDRPGRLGRRPTPTGSGRCSVRSMAKMREKRGAAERRYDGRDRVAGHRPRGGWPAGLPVQQGARPVRPVLEQRRQPGGHGGPAARWWRPNIVHVERELGVDPRDFRLWVCLHEETHRVQFTAVPWLREHLLGEMTGLLESTDLDPQKLAVDDAGRDRAGRQAGQGRQRASRCSTCCRRRSRRRSSSGSPR